MRAATRQHLSSLFEQVIRWQKANEADVVVVLAWPDDIIDRQAGTDGEQGYICRVVREYRKLLSMLKVEYGLRGVGDLHYLSPNIVLPAMIAEQIRVVERTLGPPTSTLSE
jgi:hypothetical protein